MAEILLGLIMGRFQCDYNDKSHNNNNDNKSDNKDNNNNKRTGFYSF